MDPIKYGGAAFPIPCSDLSASYDPEPGMFLRDYFAIHAPQPCQGEIEFQLQCDKNNNPHNDYSKPAIRSAGQIICDLRYKFADEMLRARAG